MNSCTGRVCSQSPVESKVQGVCEPGPPVWRSELGKQKALKPDPKTAGEIGAQKKKDPKTANKGKGLAGKA